MNQWLPQIDPQRCSGCGLCLTHCPQQALGFAGQQAVVVAPSRCDYCGVCEGICPTGAIQLPYLVCFQSTNPQETH